MLRLKSIDILRCVAAIELDHRLAPRRHIQIFLSSPGDVADERQIARDLIKDVLSVDPFIRDRATFDVISWDDPHAAPGLPAHLTPQEAINRKLPKPSDCDIVIVILWSRMGTPLPPDVTRDDGSTYQSGTEWEFEDALDAANDERRWQADHPSLSAH